MATLSTPLHVWFFLITILHFTSTSISAKSDMYIVHMDLSAMPKAFSDHHNWYTSTLSSVREDSLTITTTTTNSLNLIYTYTNVIHGFSASLSSSELESLKKSPGFVSSIRDVPVKVDTTRTSQFLQLNSMSGAWPASNYGKDVIIGVVDTGVWPESESFSDEGMTEVPSRWKGECVDGTQFNSSMCNKKLIGARFFNKGLISNKPNVTIPMNSTRDTDGHGTHTSSTAAGSYVRGASYFGYGMGTAQGMAPQARVAMYKALWEAGAYTSDIIAAIDQAIEDGVDVISLSLGLDGIPLYEDPIAIASFAAMEKGIFVATSAGNEGPWYGTLHNGIPWVLTVGAGTIDREFGGIVTLGNGVLVVGSSLYPFNSSLSHVPLMFMNTCNSTMDLKNVGSKIVVCIDTNNSVGEQVNNVNSGNVSGGLFISNSSLIEFYLESSFPAVFINPKDGQSILDYIKMSSDPRASVKFQKTLVGRRKNNPAPRVAEYSSRGPSPSCPSILKPDIMAPGTLILAAWPKSNPVLDTGSRSLFSDYNLLSGTSMSCPHAAGIAALLKGIHPQWSPAAIRSAMMTTSDTLDNTLNPIKDIGDNYNPASPLAMGSGHVNPNKAMDPGLIYDAKAEDYVSLLCSMNYTTKQIQTITRTSSGYNCSNPSLDLNYPSFIAFFNVNDSSSDTKIVQEFQRTVTNVGDGMSTYTAKLTPMDGIQVTVMPETLVFKDKYEKQSFKVSLEGPKLMKQVVVHGSLSWVEDGGKYVVTSPIVATRLSSAQVTE
ncbi:Peptidase S8/S53 domain [Macleaya cordata]|uniref:Peptidase S8/S53 domain n=1 Tax=Macleaya cordata TaxID=56857 RepID=A0A200QZF1_MACCD|nr:Peptidase S8/S53 domain [Macleaya cordata]